MKSQYELNGSTYTEIDGMYLFASDSSLVERLIPR